MRQIDDYGIVVTAAADLGLSEQRPIAASQAKHTVAGSTLRDMHWELELGVVLSGRMERVTRDSASALQPGMLWMCASWEPHGYRIVEAPCRVMVFVVNPLFLTRLSMELCGDTSLYTPFTVAAQARPQVAECFRALLLSFLQQLPTPLDQRAWQCQALQQCLLYALHRWEAPGQPLRRSEDRLGRLLPALKLAFASHGHVSSSRAARACGLSRNAFAAAFTRATGVSFADFALRRRLRGAAEALARSDDAIKAIAVNWGFSDSSHFVRSFERHYGLTPGKYRKKL